MPGSRRATASTLVCSLLEHAGVRLVLTQSGLDAEPAWPANIERLCVDTCDPAEALPPLEPVVGPDDLAYVIFTSGSTGMP